jgi:hypothetical protein
VFDLREKAAHSVFPLEDGSLVRNSTEKEAKLRERRIVSWKNGTRLEFRTLSGTSITVLGTG